MKGNGGRGLGLRGLMFGPRKKFEGCAVDKSLGCLRSCGRSSADRGFGDCSSVVVVVIVFKV